jgi:CBS domain-containing protein
MIRVEALLPSASKRLLTITDTALLVDAAAMLNRPELNIVIVCDGRGRSAGVVTKSDIVSHIGTCTGHSCMMAVTAVMSHDIVSCQPSDWLESGGSLMKEHGLKNIPVLDSDSKPVGVLTAREVVQQLLEDTRYEENLLRDYVMNVGYQ